MVLTVMGLREMEGNFGLTTLVSFRDAAGNRLKWFCSGSTEMVVDREYRVKATVKEHQVYKEQRETLLSRVTVLPSADVAPEGDARDRLGNWEHLCAGVEAESSQAA